MKILSSILKWVALMGLALPMGVILLLMNGYLLAAFFIGQDPNFAEWMAWTGLLVAVGIALGLATALWDSSK